MRSTACLAAGFALKYPEVRLEVTTEDRPVDMVEEGYDLVIRVNPDPDESLVGRIFLRDKLVVVGAPGVRRPEPQGRVAALVRSGGGQDAMWLLRNATGPSSLAIDPVLTLSSLFMLRDAVRLGAGVGRLPLSLVSHDLDAGRLEKWGDINGPETALWALYPSRRLLSVRVAAFLASLKEAFPAGTPEELAHYGLCAN